MTTCRRRWAAAGVLLAAAGCGDVEWAGQWTPRPSPPPIAGRRSPATQPTDGEATASVEAGRPVATAYPQPASTENYYFIYVSRSRPAGSRDPLKKHLVADAAPLPAMADALAALYPPELRSGSAQRPFLVFKDPAMWNAASAAAARLDVAPQKAPPADMLEGAALFAGALGFRYAQPRRRMEAGAAEAIVSAMQRVLDDASAPASRRWAAGMLAGAGAAAVDRDPTRADGLYRRAGELVEAGTCERLAAMGARALLLERVGRGDAARRIAEQVLADFPSNHHAAVYERCQRITGRTD